MSERELSCGMVGEVVVKDSRVMRKFLVFKCGEEILKMNNN